MMMNISAPLRPKRCLIGVTHDPHYARHAERNIHLFDGRVVDHAVEMAAS
jgi:ABC-type lipoprotein export system ATPase subunit